MWNPNWNRTSKSQGYITVYCPEHPKAWSTGYIYVHRIVMEEHIGRELKDNEIIHHKDGNKENNNISNLELTNQSNHASHHNPKKEELSYTCPYCGNQFKRKRSQKPSNKGYKLAFCSRSCNGKYYAYLKKKTS